MKKTLISLVLSVPILASAIEMPEAWNEHAGKNAKELWDHCVEGDKFRATRLIGVYRLYGSQHDGDRQWDVANLLSCVEFDPYEDLAHLLGSPDQYDVGFVLVVIECLGDRRFVPILEKMKGDQRSISKWDMLTYSTIGEGAKQVQKDLINGESGLEDGQKLAKWLLEAQKKHNKSPDLTPPRAPRVPE